jgi:predicted AlkP superfamily pyrophosphatase or phosphodiesterase
MRRSTVCLLVLVACASCRIPAARPEAGPRLVVVIVLDQFRYDYLTRFRTEYRGGLARLLNKGASYSNAYYVQSPTVTAVGHALLMTGAMPSISGIVGNSWFERREGSAGRLVTSGCDAGAKNVGVETPTIEARCEDWDASSPRRLLVSTIGDELRNRSEASKVIGISLKGRSAILPAGHRAQGAYWFDDKAGSFITSDFYMSQLPVWVDQINRQRLPDQYATRPWEGFPSWNFRPRPGSARSYDLLPANPWGNELVARLAEAAIDGEQLGQRDVTDLLTVSFSANDYVGHVTGPDAPEVRDMCLRTDALLAHLFDTVDHKVGAGNSLIVVTADHGVAPLPDLQAKRRMPGGYVFLDLEDLVRSALAHRFGAGRYVSAVADAGIYFDRVELQQKGISLDEACKVASEALLSVPQAHVARTYTASRLVLGGVGDSVDRAFVTGYYPSRSGDVMVDFELYEMPRTASKTTHFSPYAYDTHVPLFFMGAGIRPGRYDNTIEMNDVAPTLALLMDIEVPSGSSGRVLTQMLNANMRR